MNNKNNHVKIRRIFLKILSGFAALFLLPAGTNAQVFPDQPVTLVVGFAPGGIVDITARRLGEQLSKQWGKPVIVENRPGANANLAASIVARSAPNGYTLLITLYDSLVIAKAGQLKLTYDPMEDLTPVALIGDVESLFLVKADSPYQSMEQFLTAAQAKQGKMTFGTIGVGSTFHLTMEQMNDQKKTGLLHVPYKGGTPMATDLVAGNIESAMASSLFSKNFIESGRLRALAVAGNRKSLVFPTLPTFSELGITAEVAYALGVFAPSKVPAPIITKINADFIKILNETAMKAKFSAEGVQVGTLNPAEFKQRIIKEVNAMQEVIVKNKVNLAE